MNSNNIITKKYKEKENTQLHKAKATSKQISNMLSSFNYYFSCNYMPCGGFLVTICLAVTVWSEFQFLKKKEKKNSFLLIISSELLLLIALETTKGAHKLFS